jgi:hypothetical protein
MAAMNPHADAFWDLTIAPTRSEAEKRKMAEELWLRGGHELGFFAAVIAYETVARASRLVDRRFQPADASPELLMVVDPINPDRASQAGKETWNLLAKARVSESTGVVDPFVAAERRQIIEHYGSIAVFWMAYWATKAVFTVATHGSAKFAEFVGGLESFVDELPEDAPI